MSECKNLHLKQEDICDMCGKGRMKPMLPPDEASFTHKPDKGSAENRTLYVKYFLKCSVCGHTHKNEWGLAGSRAMDAVLEKSRNADTK